MIYLMRHGQDDERFVGGWSDVGLIDSGKKEVDLQGKWLKENLQIKKIITSPVYRARQSAEIVNQHLHVPLMCDENLKEQSKGMLNGINKRIVKFRYASFMDNVDINTVYPGGESLKQLYERIKEYLNKIYEFGDDTLIITHRGVINMIYYILDDIDLDMQKERFNVETASVHELNMSLKKIRRIK